MFIYDYFTVIFISMYVCMYVCMYLSIYRSKVAGHHSFAHRSFPLEALGMKVVHSFPATDGVTSGPH